MDLSSRPERPKPAGWVIAEFTSGALASHLYRGGQVFDDEAEGKRVVEDHDSPERPLVLYALVPAWGPIEQPTATVAKSDPTG